jgi:hypothetical protein
MRPWTAVSEYRVYQQALEQIVLADQLGFDQVIPQEKILASLRLFA